METKRHREAALADGLLYDVSHFAKKVGFLYPVALTDEVQDIIESPDPTDDWYLSTEDRLWYLLNIGRLSSKYVTPGSFSVTFPAVMATEKTENRDDPKHVKSFTMLVGIDDDDQPAVTFFTTEEVEDAFNQ